MRSKRKPAQSRSAATDSEVGRAVSFANPMYASNTETRTGEDMYVDNTAAAEPAYDEIKVRSPNTTKTVAPVANPMYDTAMPSSAPTYDTAMPASSSTDYSEAPVTTPMADSYLDATEIAPARQPVAPPAEGDSYLDVGASSKKAPPAQPIASASPVQDSYLDLQQPAGNSYTPGMDDFETGFGEGAEQDEPAGGYLAVGADAE
eukprot:m.203559 g.203559  ORF g.203559 m.203559 type:complete len:204 (-) comp53856_c0_seq3:735-1346(-)